MLTHPEPVRVGLVLPGRDVELPGGPRLPALVDLAVRAERAGLDSVWVGDSPLARPRPDPFALLGAVAEATATIGFGTAALLPALRHPLVTAHALATLDQLAPGRLTVGVGAGFPVEATRDEMAAFGVGFAGRAQRLDLTVRFWKALWSGAPPSDVAEVAAAVGVDASPELLAELPTPATPGGPGVWLASGDSAAATERAGRIYDGWLPYVPTAAAYRQGREAMTAARSTPGSPTFGLYATVALAGPGEAVERARVTAAYEAYLSAYYGVPAELVESIQLCRVGEPTEVADHLAAYVEAGARHLVVRLAAPVADLDRQLDLLAADLVHRLQASLAREQVR